MVALRWISSPLPLLLLSCLLHLLAVLLLVSV